MGGLDVDSNSRLVKPLPTAFITAEVVELLFNYARYSRFSVVERKLSLKGHQLPQAFFLNGMKLGGASAPRLPRRSTQKMKGLVSLIDDSFERLMQKFIEGVVNTGKWGYYLN